MNNHKYALFKLYRALSNTSTIHKYSTGCKSANYCIDLVRQCEHENFLCTLLLPPNLQSTAFAVRAFNIEISRIQEQISDEKIGQMRVRFWRDCLEGIYCDKPPEHPVAMEIHKAVRRHKLTKRYFTRLIMSRAGQLNLSCFKNTTAMETYCEQSVSSIYLLLLEAAGNKNEATEFVAKHLGISQGITNLLRGLQYNLQQEMIFLPQDLLASHGVSEESLYRGNVHDDFNKLVHRIAETASSHLQQAKEAQEDVPKPARLIFLPTVTVYSYLKRLEKHSFNVFNHKLSGRNPLLPFQLWWHKLRKIY